MEPTYPNKLTYYPKFVRPESNRISFTSISWISNNLKSKIYLKSLWVDVEYKKRTKEKLPIYEPPTHPLKKNRKKEKTP